MDRKLLSLHAKLSSILEVDLQLARKQQREAISNHESEAAGHNVGTLLDYYQALEDCWTGVRWIREVLSVSRLKTTQCGISVHHLTEWYLNQPETPDDSQYVPGGEISVLQIKSANLFKMDTMRNWNARGRDSAASDSGTLQSRQGLSRTPTTRSDPQEFGMMDMDKDGANLTNLAHVRSRLLADGPHLLNPPVSYISKTYSNSTNSIDSNENEYASNPRNNFPPESNILQVYAAYDTGLAHGTSVRIKVSTATTAREVVDLVIKQLNMAVILKGKDSPIYENEKLGSFCLVAVIGSRERCLRDDFKPLNLQNPWKKGRLFVRMKHDLLAAIEHLSKHTTLI